MLRSTTRIISVASTATSVGVTALGDNHRQEMAHLGVGLARIELGGGGHQLLHRAIGNLGGRIVTHQAVNQGQGFLGQRRQAPRRVRRR